MTGLRVAVGDRFDTASESGCVVTAAPGSDAGCPTNFWALDSDGVECLYNTVMLLPCPFSAPIFGAGPFRCALPKGHRGAHTVMGFDWDDDTEGAVSS